ncbi:MAG: S8/S53 family peptidase [Gemmatimonadetes bacterium]|nr:S8/S53 family peptidase [Gemmatimonadota bacterium]
MRKLVALFLWPALGLAWAGNLSGQSQPVSTDPPIADTPFSIHQISPAHGVTLGKGARVGILDHSFDLDSHPELYAGGRGFWNRGSASEDAGDAHRGYWMALTLRAVAPEAHIFALGVPPRAGKLRAEAMAKALEWAAGNHLDVVTYCGADLSPAEREILDPAVEKAVEAGVVVVFVGYSHPLNLLPRSFGPPLIEGGRAPDLNIFSYECTAMVGDEVVTLIEADDDAIRRNRPFLGRSSVGPVTAGLVALVKSVDPHASPGEVKTLLVEASRPLEFQGRLEPWVPDAFEAVRKAVGTRAGRPF